MRRSRELVVLVALAAMTLTGCAGDSSSGASDDPTREPSSVATSPPGEPTPTSEETCPYLTAEQVAEVLETSAHETAGSVHACFFDSDDDERGPSVMVSRVDVQIDPADYAAQTRTLCLGEVTDIEMGDEAFACVMGTGPQAQVYMGKVLMTVNVTGAPDDAAGLSMASALLRELTVPSVSG